MTFYNATAVTIYEGGLRGHVLGSICLFPLDDVDFEMDAAEQLLRTRLVGHLLFRNLIHPVIADMSEESAALSAEHTDSTGVTFPLENMADADPHGMAAAAALASHSILDSNHKTSNSGSSSSKKAAVATQSPAVPQQSLPPAPATPGLIRASPHMTRSPSSMHSVAAAAAARDNISDPLYLHMGTDTEDEDTRQELRLQQRMRREEAETQAGGVLVRAGGKDEIVLCGVSSSELRRVTFRVKGRAVEVS